MKAFFVNRMTGTLYEIQGELKIKKYQANTKYQQIDAQTAMLRADFGARSIVT